MTEKPTALGDPVSDRVEAWIMEEDESPTTPPRGQTYASPFQYVCEVLGIDADYVCAGLRRWRDTQPQSGWSMHAIRGTPMPHRREAVDAAHLLLQLRKTRDTAAQQLRLSFKRHGWDVSAIGAHEIGKALLEAAIPGTHSSRDLFGRAFERLKNRGAGAR